MTKRLTAGLVSGALILLAAPTAPARASLSYSQELKAQSSNKLSEGIKALRDGHPGEAIQLLEQVATVFLNSFRAHYYLGRAYSADRQYTKAIEPLTFALELNPTHMQAHVDLGDCFLKLGDIDEALAEYYRAKAIQEGFAPAWDGIARAEEARGDDDKAVESFRKAIDLNPGFPDASLNLGDLYLRKARLQEAVDLFLKAIAIRPNFAAAYNRLGVAYARQHLGNEAIAALRKAAELESGNPWHPYTIGLIEMDLGYLGQATRDLDAAIELDEHYLEAYVAKAKLLRRLGNFADAAALLREARTKPSDDASLLRQIDELEAEVSAQQSVYDRLIAKTGSGEATEEDVRSLAALKASVGDYSGAARVFAPLAGEPADGVAPDPAVVPSASDLFTLGYYYLKAGAYEQAESTYRALSERDGADPSVGLNLALSVLSQGKGESAEPVLRRALQMEPADPALLTALGNTLVLLGRYEEAEEAYRKVLDYGAGFEGRPRVETILKALEGRKGASRPSGGGR